MTLILAEVNYTHDSIEIFTTTWLKWFDLVVSANILTYWGPIFSIHVIICCKYWLSGDIQLLTSVLQISTIYNMKLKFLLDKIFALFDLGVYSQVNDIIDTYIRWQIVNSIKAMCWKLFGRLWTFFISWKLISQLSNSFTYILMELQIVLDHHAE